MSISANKKTALTLSLVKFKEKLFILFLCLIAAAHVFIYSATFPFFNNVDEPYHFDMVVKYSQTHFPRGLETVSPESSYYLVMYNCMAYTGQTNSFLEGQFPHPLWTESSKDISDSLSYDEAFWERLPNYECSQAPLYYFVTGTFWDIEKRFGFSKKDLIYSIRFLNAAFVAILVWLGYVAVRIVFPENLFLKLAVPALLASMPQTSFYSIDNDVLSPVCYGALFICLLRLICKGAINIKAGLLFGAAFAAAFLTKATNLPMLGIAAIIAAVKLWQLTRVNKISAVSKFILSAFIIVAPPIITWCLWCKNHFGDLTGAHQNIEFMGWTLKPFAEWWQHPIFSPHGFWICISAQLKTFWRGEFMWHNEPLASTTIDMIYIISSLIFLCTAVTSLIPKLSSASQVQKQAVLTSFLTFLSGMIFFAFLSIIYDFHNTHGPSPEHIYFSNGRLILGSLIPFLLLIVYGLDRLLIPIKCKWPKFLILIGIIFYMLISEAVVDSPIFQNEFNWFHAM